MAVVAVAFTATTHSITHPRPARRLRAEHARGRPSRGGRGADFDGGSNTDYEWLRETTAAVRDVLATADRAVVTSPAGTDVTMDPTDRPAFALDGFFHEYGFSALPPGEAPTAPVEVSAQGAVVIGYSMDDAGLLDEPIELTFADGVVTNVERGAGAAALRELMAGVDDAGTLAAFAIGTTPDARLVGNLAEDEKRPATAHFAIGDNESPGGTVQCDIHLGGVAPDPTVVLDGETVVDHGDVQLDRIRRLAASLA